MPSDTRPIDAGHAPPPRQPVRLRLPAIIAGLIALVIVVAGLITRAHESSEVKSWTADNAVPAVRLVEPTTPSGGQVLVLPGALQAYYNAQIYARVPGYLRAWYADIGAPVKAGQVLAVIDTPELDQQLIQAKADLASAEASMRLAKITADRWSKLLTKDAVSTQEADEKAGDFATKSAQVNAAKANLNRLTALKGFARIVAPFDGVVTARKTDIGALINAGATATPNSELFDVAKVDRLRLYVHVPQSDSSLIARGAKASLSVPEYPGQSFTATLNTTANSISGNSGTLLVELLVENQGARLKDGDYAQVKFTLGNAPSGGSAALQMPASALLFRKQGAEAAVVGPDNHVHLRAVSIARDLGATMEISSGLTAGDRVIDNPPDSIAEGQLVRVVQSGPTSALGGHDGKS